MYLLNVETGETIPDPSDEQIRQHVLLCSGGESTGINLSKYGLNDLAYMSTDGNVEDGYVLNYCDEHSHACFQCRHLVPAGDVVRAMQAYAHGLSWWKTAFDWEWLFDL